MRHDQQDRSPEYSRALQFMFLRFASLASIIGLILLVINAPLWIFYAAPLIILPLLFWELPRLERMRLDQIGDTSDDQ